MPGDFESSLWGGGEVVMKQVNMKKKRFHHTFVAFVYDDASEKPSHRCER